MEYPGASRIISYTYDALNRISLVQEGSTPSTFAIHKYVGPGRLSERRYNKVSDGSTEVTTLSVSYDGVGMITRYEHKDSNPSTVVGFVYGRDKVGNSDYELRLHQSSEGDEYKYDGLYRVTATVYDDAAPATPTAPTAGTGSDIFYYDGVGNRTRAYERSASATEYLHNPVNEYTKVANTEWEHDAAGNLTRDESHYYYWDYENRLTRVTDQEATPNVLADFRYDAGGRLIEKVADGTTTRYYLDGVRIVEETEGTQSPTVERQYAYGPGIDDVLVLFDKNGETYDVCYYLKDPLRTVEALVDEDGNIVEAYAYEVYGKPTIKTGDGGDGDWFDGDETTAASSAKDNPYLFTARRWDSDISLQFNRARWYNPDPGRWLSRDPLEYADGANVYLYVASNPPTYADPFGLEGLTPEEIDNIIKKAKGKALAYRLGGTDLAKRLFKRWLSGIGGVFPLTEDDVKKILGTPQAQAEIARIKSEFRSSLCTRCPQHGVTQYVQARYSGKATYPKPSSVLDRSTEADLFYSFHNVYFKVQFSGCARRDGDTVTFNGDIWYFIYDQYKFRDRGWTAIPGDNEATDFIFWVWQEHGKPAPFWVAGNSYERKVTMVEQCPGGPTNGGGGGGGGY